jgi:hypothetical protein
MLVPFYVFSYWQAISEYTSATTKIKKTDTIQCTSKHLAEGLINNYNDIVMCLVYDWSTRCKLRDILEGLATTKAQEGGADSPGTGSIETSVSRVLKKMNNNGLVHGNGLHLIKELLETKEGAAGTAGDQPPRGLNP